MKKRETVFKSTTLLAEMRVIEEIIGSFDILVTIKARSLDDLHNIVTGNIVNIDGVNRG